MEAEARFKKGSISGSRRVGECGCRRLGSPLLLLTLFISSKVSLARNIYPFPLPS